MVSDNSFDDTIFSFMDISFNELSAAKLIEDKYAVFVASYLTQLVLSQPL